ncbi:MAG: heat-inducible transcriptional repressor HrcA [Gammaproteobacteria bacterium RBG_16_57_12]|nr:MAG: heat-inducible transcriptional repressor HrcA [Gammaproteobacteria bacterium RBG_16_57_12]
MSSHATFGQRSQVLLKALIERYVREGQPVGSRTLADDSRLQLSPATVRNIMAELEDLGLIKSPHTSAGRIPTASGYRVFVDTLLTVKPLAHSELRQLQEQIPADVTPDELLQSASTILSGITRMAGVVMLPKRLQLSLRQIDFLPLAEKKVLVILVINSREVQNRIIHTDRNYSAAELQQAANYINQHFTGKSLEAVREGIVREMSMARDSMSQIMLTAIEMADKAISEAKQPGGCVVAGQTNLMNYAEMGDVDKLRQLFEAFNQQQSILYLLDQSIIAEGMQIFIGEESGYEVFDDCSVITAPYRLAGEVVGVLGVIGPTRMDYERMIPIVDVTARLVGAALNSPE